MSEAADVRGGGLLDASERIKVIGRFRPLEPGAEAAQWLINGTTLTYAICIGLKPLTTADNPIQQTPEGLHAHAWQPRLEQGAGRARDLRRVGAAVHVRAGRRLRPRPDAGARAAG